MRAAVVAAVLALMVGGSALAQSKCDSGVTKAAGKKVACKASVISKAQKKGTTPDSAKLAKCEDKFTKACTKAKSAADCSAQPQSCAAIEAEADTCVTTISSGSSPSGAFLE
jgi:hypothetical protein